ncbi:hypothetical protein DICPUDRAFT_48551 [Dictyostelium purpureum]|uniref:GPR180/TMEM145 transmembrane domain-containing protein n=1 Tax=Dictyostelium purpureum TaxID=5786 RepID=F0ZPL8_DICPU|nr:uncharacterized protein DICPUDRAFT_48551 [Dictyostelium purpureum]EGC34110.1 hypothetical protein DICPUDRAFT_48551 [Dictyostelium purpureum]|eukprot:XP_003289356.1 hypothetical protein DICPUDRAFT_48551 [Dictyostelium purpureum]
MKIYLFLVLVFSLLTFSNSLDINGFYSKPREWQFITKFCFQENGGQIVMRFFNSFSKNTKLYLYSDRNPNYQRLLDDMHGNKYSCQEKVSWSNYSFSPFDIKDDQGPFDSHMQVKEVTQQRDRFWVIGIADCDSKSTSKYYAQYYFTLLNNGDKIDSVLSADQQSIPQSHMFFFLLYIILFVTSIVFTIILKRKGLEPKVVLFFSLVVFIHLASIILFLTNWANLIRHQTEIKLANLFGNCFNILGNCIFILLLLMVGQGYTTSIYYGSVIKKIVNVAVVSLIFVLSIIIYVCYIYKLPDYNNYVYFLDTISGYVCLSFYVIIIFYFIIGNLIAGSKQNDPLKKKFIKIFTFIFCVWLIAQPLVVLAAHFTEPWVKYKVITILNLVINSIFFIVFLVMFRPTQNNLVVKILQHDEKLGDNPLQIRDGYEFN